MFPNLKKLDFSALLLEPAGTCDAKNERECPGCGFLIFDNADGVEISYCECDEEETA